MSLQLELGRATQPRLAGAPANAMKGHGKGHGKGPKAMVNRAQRLDQAARRARAWAENQRRAHEQGTEVETPAVVRHKAERRAQQRERAAARRRGEWQEEHWQEERWQEDGHWQEEDEGDRRHAGEASDQQQSSDERSRSARGVSPALSLRSAAHVHRMTDARPAHARPAFRPARDLLARPGRRGLELRNIRYDEETGLPYPAGMANREATPDPSEVTPASEHEHEPSEVTPASDHEHEHEPSEVTPAESSDFEVQVIPSGNRRARWSDQPSDDRRDASDDRCDEEAPDDRRRIRQDRIVQDYLDNFEIFFYSCDKDSYEYCTTHNEALYGQTIYYDVREFKDPDADQSVRRHDGRNRRIQSGLVGAHRYKFMLMVRNVVRDVREALLAGKKGVAVAFWCNHGKHRSVACAEVMAGCVLNKFVNVTIEHISCAFYDMHCRCPECSRILPDKDILRSAWGTFEKDWWVVDLRRR